MNTSTITLTEQELFILLTLLQEDISKNNILSDDDMYNRDHKDLLYKLQNPNKGE